MQALIQNYLKSAHRIIDLLNVSEIESLALAIAKVRSDNRSVFLIGNGGSAATASHFMTDLGIGSLRSGKAVRAISLTDNSEVMTAISNDMEFESIFQQQIITLGQSGDLLVLISASGNSRNLLSALNLAQTIGMGVFTLTGFDGGELRRMTPGFNVHVPSEMGQYGLVEDAHLALCHMVTECIRAK